MIYFDNSATTSVLPEVAELAKKCFLEQFGNPSSLHSMGFEAESILEHSRTAIAETLGCRAENIIFTHNATFANNLAILGTMQPRRRGNVVLSSIEHSSILAVGKELTARGVDVSYAKATHSGEIEPEAVASLVNQDTVLVSVMHINSETGAINDIKAISTACRRKNPRVIIHSDCVQSYAKYDLKELVKYVDMLTAAGHKINAPKGAAFLYRKKGIKLKSLYFGSSQENGLFSGTENVPAIYAMAGAATIHYKNLFKNYEKLCALNSYFRERLSEFGGVTINSAADAAPHILNISVLGYRSEILLHFFAQSGIYVSSGSACAKGKPSHVLLAMGLPRQYIDSAIRISMCAENTTDEIDEFCSVLSRAMTAIHRESRGARG